MTNEEKAKEIEAFFETPNPKDARFIMCYQSALEMAEWKDRQFKEYLKSFLSIYVKDRDYFLSKGDSITANHLDMKIGCIQLIIYEFFGE